MKKLISLVTLYWMALCLTACGQTRTISENSVEISNSDSSNIVSYDAQNTEDAAKLNPITYYANTDDFPISVRISTSGLSTKDYSFSSYGRKLITKVDFANMIYNAYAYIMIEPYPEEVETPTVTNDDMGNTADIVDSDMEHTVSADDVEAVTNDSVDVASSNDNDKRIQDLLEEPTPELLRNPESVHSQEINEFLTGQWDGYTRTNHIEANDGTVYTVTRDLLMRQYIWTKIDPTGKVAQDKFINIDYDGPLDVVGAGLPGECYSLATDHENGLIEQWSLFEKQDSWQIPLAKNETIDHVVAVSYYDVRGTVEIVNTSGEMYEYDLLVGGKMEKK